ncbi:PKD domain-containing protein [Halorussus lipolyticus]|uniref:PKD domain-containing protein n=1 Tax=Halorussus lipolyticus TaxID=3034024 RepID=UPI0023E8DA8B|nr:PKD domain-containing protein [Halorussus sp. DT80]
MWKQTLVGLAVLLVVTTPVAGTLGAHVAAPTADASPANEAPLADAGLDQDVRKGATVLLDGTGSRDPDGRIEAYDWSIRTPSNQTITPDCTDCNRTRFTPAETGRYRVTLTVTDEEGASSADTLYVEVSPGTKPTVSVSGPQQSTTGATETYSADLSAGSATLDYIVWTIDGVELANHSLSPAQSGDTVSKHFPTVGNRSLTATVHDVDGQTDTSSLTTSVRRQQDSPSEPPEEGSIADGNSPTVSGDTLVTGSRPLRGTYSVQLDSSAQSVASVEWRNAAGRIGSGQALSRDWEPGNHELYALVTYTDGSENVATFSDGTMTVVADPRPNASLSSLDRYGVISGTANGIDEYENLDTLRVEVDGETVATAGSSVRLDTDYEQMVHFSSDDFTPGESHSVTVIATDERGQTTSVSREITPVKEPEIVRSEFVNGPVDSYHERIDPKRYVAHHVLEIDLNGVDIENLEIDFSSEDRFVRKLYTNNHGQWQEHKNGDIITHTYWSGKRPKEYDINIDSSASPHGLDVIWKNKRSSSFQVTKSKPELRLDVLNDGTKDEITREHGISVNASGSFDPDGTDLKYIWKYGAEPTKPDNTTAKFYAYDRAATIVEDQYDLRTKRNFNFLDYFVPDIAGTNVTSTGPYYADDTVRISVETEPYHFSKQTYYNDFSLGLAVANPDATVSRWESVSAPDSSHSEPTEDAYKYVGIVEVPATEISAHDSTVTAYNVNNTRKETKTTLPEVEVLLENREYWSDVSIENLTYLVKKPKIREVTVRSEEKRDQYLDEEYHINKIEEDTKYILEERVKTQEAKYGKVTKRFSNKRFRGQFLDSMRKWYADGVVREQETRIQRSSSWFDASTTSSPRKWNDLSLWNGEQSGETREVKVQDAEYETEKKYRYEYKVEKTRTKIVERCSLRFGCRDVEVTETYTVTKSDTYWATSSRGYDHEFTGRTRRIKIEDAVYETQFEVEYKSKSTEWVTDYKAARDKKVQKAQYDWKARTSTMDYVVARKKASGRSDWRITEESVPAWVLVRDDGTSKYWTDVYANKSHVAKTQVKITGQFTKEFYNPKTGNVTKKIEHRTTEQTDTGAKNAEDIYKNITTGEEDSKWCERKASCPEENGGD